MSKALKIYLLLFALIFYSTAPALALSIFEQEAANKEELDKKRESGANSFHNSLATNPGCLMDLTNLIKLIAEVVSGIGNVFAGKASIASGTALLALPDPTGITKIKGGALIVSGTIELALGLVLITDAILGGVGFGVCVVSFVRDPVTYYPEVLPADHPDKNHEGKMMMAIKNKNGLAIGFQPVKEHYYDNKELKVKIKCKDENDCYFLGMPTTSSDKLTVCSRELLPIGIFGSKGCYSGTSGEIGSKYPYYNGPTSILCPEEARQVKRLYELGADHTGYIKLKCKKKNPDKCEGNERDLSYKKGNSLEKTKLTFGRPTCKTGKKDDELKLNGHTYKIVQKGTKLCARLKGAIGSIPFHQDYDIGCIPKLNTNLIPKCATSKPIYENRTYDPDSGLLTFYGDSLYRVIGYDDRVCYNSGSISQLCTTEVTGLFQAPIPITSYLMGCLRDSIDSLLYGDNKNINNTGMLDAMQSRMKIIIIILITLSIILFGIQLLFFDSQPKLADMMVFILKIAFVLYLTTSHNRDNGMAIYSKYINTISTTLQSMVLDTSAKNGLCDYSSVKYDLKIPQQGTVAAYTKNFDYLRMWDILDCRFAYYFSTSFANATQNFSISDPLDGGSKPYDNNFFGIIGAFGMPFAFILTYIGLFLFAVFLLFTIIQICELIILSTLAFSVVILLSPVFVPFILFKPTKSMFDSWLNTVITYSLFPVLIFAFMGFMFLVVDNITFGKTQFVPVKNVWVAGNKTTVFAVDPNNKIQNCSGFKVMSEGATIDDKKIGDIPLGCDCSGTHCMLNNVVVKTTKGGEDSIIGESARIELKMDEDAQDKFQLGVLALMFTMFIFYHLSKRIFQLLNMLSGGSRAMMSAINPSAHAKMEKFGSVAAGLANSNNNKKKYGGDKKNNQDTKKSASTRKDGPTEDGAE